MNIRFTYNFEMEDGQKTKTNLGIVFCFNRVDQTEYYYDTTSSRNYYSFSASTYYDTDRRFGFFIPQSIIKNSSVYGCLRVRSSNTSFSEDDVLASWEMSNVEDMEYNGVSGKFYYALVNLAEQENLSTSGTYYCNEESYEIYFPMLNSGGSVYSGNLKISYNAISLYIDDTKIDDISTVTMDDIANKKISFVADDDYKVNAQDIPRFVYYNSYASQLIKYFTINDDNKSGYIDLSNSTDIEYNRDISIYILMVYDSPVIDVYGFINVYLPTNTDIVNILSNRYKSEDVGYYAYYLFDLMEYVVSLKRVFINVNTTEQMSVKLGKYDTGVVCNIATDLYYNYDCGTIHIDEIYNNYIDYACEYYAFLPFYGIYKLDKSIMNKNINISYKCNIVTSDCIIFIKDNDTDEILFTIECTCGFNVPYIISNDTGVQNTLQTGKSFMYEFTPYIYIRYPSNIEKQSLTLNSKKTDFINNFNGYCKFSDIVGDVNCLYSERQTIISMLKEGIEL